MIRPRMQAQILSIFALTALLAAPAVAAPAAERVDRCAAYASQGPVSPTRDEHLQELRTEFKLTNAARQGGTVTIAERTDISTLNGLLVESWPTRHVTQLIFEGLTTISPIDGTPVPRLADSWEVSEDGRTYTFHLSQEARWHDGVDFTANDVAFSFDVLKDNSLEVGGRPDFERSDVTYRVVDDDTFEISVGEPTVTFLWEIPAAISIVPRHLWQDIEPSLWRADPGSTGTNPDRVIGTGPFKFRQRVEHASVTLVRNDQHYSSIPNIDAFVYQVVENSERDDALKSGQVDIVEGIQTDLLQAELNNNLLDARIFPTMRMNYYAYNTLHPPLDDLRVRQALYVGLNRQEIIDTINLGYGEMAAGMQPPMSMAYAPESVTDRYDFDQDRARALLEEAGWSDTDGDGLVDKDGKDLRIDIVGNRSAGGIEELLAVIERQWSEIGVGVNPATDPWSVIEAQMRQEIHNFDVFVGFTRLRCHGDQGNLFHSDGSLNITGWANDEYDSLDEQQRQEFDPTKRREQLIQLSKLAWDELPIGIIRFYDVPVLWNAAIHNFNPNDPGGTYWSMPFVWLDDSAG